MTIEQGAQIVVNDKHYKKQIKTSRFKPLNWLFGKIYGYKKVYFLADGEIFFYKNAIYMNPNTFECLSVGLKEQKNE